MLAVCDDSRIVSFRVSDEGANAVKDISVRTEAAKKILKHILWIRNLFDCAERAGARSVFIRISTIQRKNITSLPTTDSLFQYSC